MGLTADLAVLFALTTVRPAVSMLRWLNRALSRTKHIWYSEHGTYYQFEIILE